MSAVLIYNLPETVRESDVEKLSFAVQLAEGFYSASQVDPTSILYLSKSAPCKSSTK